MNFADYFVDRIFSVICCLTAGLLISALLWLIEVPVIFIAFTLVVLLMSFTISLLWDFQRRSSFYNQILKLLAQLDEKTLLSEIAARPNFLDGQIISEILRQSNKYQNDKIAEIQQQNREYRDFLDTWVHEIKTPITSARLIVENAKNPITIRIDDELRKIDHFVELVLYYARSSDVEKDFQVEKTTVKEIVSMALKAYSKAIIQAGGRINMEQLDVPIRVDKKSCAFVIGQIISNAIKYRQDDFTLIFSTQTEKNRLVFIIQDNGIGIDATDLPRVFDKGFTGKNGRHFAKSTGIGLYLCKKLCTKMNIEISISSSLGKGTKLTLYLPTESLLQEAGL